MSCTSAQSKEDKTTATTQTTNSTVESSLIHYNGELCNVWVENTLYEGSNPNYFYIKVEIKNTSENRIGIDLKDKCVTCLCKGRKTPELTKTNKKGKNMMPKSI